MNNFKGKNNPNYKHGYYCGNPQKCIQCKQNITSGSKSGYCSSCSKQNRKNPNFKFGKYCFPNYCECGKKIDYRATFCWNCYKLSNFGKKNPNYINGRSREPYSMEFNNTLKELIRKRDQYTCQKCREKGKHVHHINYDKQNCKKENLITLCNKCNCEVNANRDYWFAYFKYVMENNNERN